MHKRGNSSPLPPRRKRAESVEQLQLAAQIGKQLLEQNNELESSLQEARDAESEALAKLDMAAQYGKQLLEQVDELECALQASRKAEGDALEKLGLLEKQTDALDPSSTAGKLRQLQQYNLKLELENTSLSEKVSQQHDQLGLMGLRFDQNANLGKEAKHWQNEAEELSKKCSVAKEEHEQDIFEMKQLQVQLRDATIDLKQWQDGGLGKQEADNLRLQVNDYKAQLQVAESGQKGLQNELTELSGKSREEEKAGRTALEEKLQGEVKKVRAAAEEEAQLRSLLAEARSREKVMGLQMKELKQQQELETHDVDQLQQQVFDAEVERHIAVERAVRQEREEAAVEIRTRMENELELARKEEREKVAERTKEAMEDANDMNEIELQAVIALKEEEQESAIKEKEEQLNAAIKLKEAEKESAIQEKETAHAQAIKVMEEEHALATEEHALATALALEEQEAEAQVELERINHILVGKMEAKVAETAMALEHKAAKAAVEAQRLEAQLGEARRREVGDRVFT
jgi:hypothetical protein